jgi:hypothetical protein
LVAFSFFDWRIDIFAAGSLNLRPPPSPFCRRTFHLHWWTWSQVSILSIESVSNEIYCGFASSLTLLDLDCSFHLG